MLDNFLDDLFEEYQNESFELDNTLLEMGVNEDQQRAIYEAKQQVLEQYTTFKKNKHKNYLRIKKEVYDRISQIEQDKGQLLEENINLQKSIEDLQTKLSSALKKDTTTEGLQKQIEQLDRQNIDLSNALLNVYKKYSCLENSDKDIIKSVLTNYIEYVSYYKSI